MGLEGEAVRYCRAANPQEKGGYGKEQLEMKMRARLISKQVNKDGKVEEERREEKRNDFHRDKPQGMDWCRPSSTEKQSRAGRTWHSTGSGVVRCLMGG